MLFYKDGVSGEVKTFGNSEVEVKGNTVVAKETFLAKSDDYKILNEQGEETNILFEGHEYTLEEKSELEKIYELIKPKLEDDVDYNLLKIIVNLKEIKLIRALINLDFEDLQSIINYDAVYNKSKNKKFIPELSIYNLDCEQPTLSVGQQILKLRTKIYESAQPEEKNHVVFSIKNPVVWLPYDIKIKRILCGMLQYRKGLHTREFDLMVYNLNLLHKFKLDKDKIKYAELMRDHNLL